MLKQRDMGVRRFGHTNWVGLKTLYLREVERFLSVYSQTIIAPVATSALFMLVFTLAFADRRGDIASMAFEDFLAPGILMMTVIQNAFANTSSSLMIAKIQGNIVDTLMPPLSPWEILAGYVLGGATRGIVCALVVGIIIFPAVGIGVAHPVWALAFAIAGSLMLATAGLLAAIVAEKFDQMAAVTNFLITPLAFLSGTFYSISVLPEAFQSMSRLNPVFYLIDGFRFSALGVSDADPAVGLAVALIVTAALMWLAWHWLSTGFRMKA